MRRRLFASVLTATTAATTAAVLAAAPAQAALVDDPVHVGGVDPDHALVPMGTFETGQFDVSAAEIVAFVPGAERVLTVNALSGRVDVLDASDVEDPTKTGEIDVVGVTDVAGDTIPEGSQVNSVAVRSDGLAVVAVERAAKTDAGWAVLADVAAPTPTILGAVRVGAQPDAVTISPDGRYAVTSDEGEPNDDYTVDPEGTVSVLTLPAAGTLAAIGQDAVATADFRAYDDGTAVLHPDVLVFAGTQEVSGVAETSPIAQNLEPEYATVVDGTAYVALQENNAIAVVDLPTASVTDIHPLGFKDHGLPGNAMDASDRDGRLDITPQPGVRGIYQPDGIGSYQAGGQTYLVTANEGDAREWGDYVQGSRVKDLAEDGRGAICADSPLAARTGDAELGRLNVDIELGLDATGTCYEELYSFGARSFSVWTAAGELVFDSGADLERITAAAEEDFFNSNHSESGFDGRSDDKGPEPENLAVGRVGERTYAFVGLERAGGVVTYHITDPANPVFTSYVNNRDFSVSMEDSEDAGSGAADLPRAGDLGPEGIAFVPAESSPSGDPLVVVGNEVSGTTTIYTVGGTGEGPKRNLDLLLASTPTLTAADITGFSPADGVGEVLVGDWDGDGIDTAGTRIGNMFRLSNDNSLPGYDHVFAFGRPGDTVLVGDWDGDGTDTVAVRRGNIAYMDNDNAGGVVEASTAYGLASDVAVAGDWDGDGKDTLGVRRGAVMMLTNTLAGGEAQVVFDYGKAGDVPLAGDWDGDGTDTVGVRRANVFHLRNALGGGTADVTTAFGRASDAPLAGTWVLGEDGTGADSIGVVRP